MGFLATIVCVLFMCANVWGEVGAVDLPELTKDKFDEIMKKMEPITSSELTSGQARILSSRGIQSSYSTYPTYPSYSSSSSSSSSGFSTLLSPQLLSGGAKADVLSYFSELRGVTPPSPVRIDEQYIVNIGSGEGRIRAVLSFSCEDFDLMMTLYVLRNPNEKISSIPSKLINGKRTLVPDIEQVERDSPAVANCQSGFDSLKFLTKTVSGYFKFQKDGDTAVVHQLSVYPFKQDGDKDTVKIHGLHEGHTYEGIIKQDYNERLIPLYQSMCTLLLSQLGFKRVTMNRATCDNFAFDRLTDSDICNPAFVNEEGGTYSLDLASAPSGQ